jgi:hypothetical protein
MARSPSRNPLAVDPEREHRVRERAYHLWEADGKPHGRDVEYWEKARELIGREESADIAHPPDPKVAAKAARQTSNEETTIRENPGESLNRPLDKVEAKPTPAPKRKSRAKPKKPA